MYLALFCVFVVEGLLKLLSTSLHMTAGLSLRRESVVPLKVRARAPPRPCRSPYLLSLSDRVSRHTKSIL